MFVVQTFEVQIPDFSAGVDQVTGLQEPLVARLEIAEVQDCQGYLYDLWPGANDTHP